MGGPPPRFGKRPDFLCDLFLPESIPHVSHLVADVSHVTIYNFPIESNFQNIRAKVKFRLHEWETKMFDDKMGNITKKDLKENHKVAFKGALRNRGIPAICLNISSLNHHVS